MHATLQNHLFARHVTPCTGPFINASCCEARDTVSMIPTAQREREQGRHGGKSSRPVRERSEGEVMFDGDESLASSETIDRDVSFEESDPMQESSASVSPEDDRWDLNPKTCTVTAEVSCFRLSPGDDR
jgi:hypothetical protein